MGEIVEPDKAEQPLGREQLDPERPVLDESAGIQPDLATDGSISV